MMELQRMTTTAHTETLRANDLGEKLERLATRASAHHTTVATASESLGVAKELCKHLEREALQTREWIAELEADAISRISEAEDRAAKSTAGEAKLAKLYEACQAASTAKVEELRRLRISLYQSTRWREAREPVSK